MSVEFASETPMDPTPLSTPMDETARTATSEEPGAAGAMGDAMESSQPAPPGLVAVQAGRVVVQLPSPASAKPSITPGANVSVIVNGQPISQTTTIDAGDEVVLEAIAEPPAVEVWVEVTKGGVEAVAHVIRRPGVMHEIRDAAFAPHVTVSTRPAGVIAPPAVTVEQVKKALADAGVAYGVNEEAIEALTGRQELQFSAVVAAGRLPSDPIDAHVKPVAPEREPVSTFRQDDVQRVDLLDRGEIFSVNEGEVVAEWVEARPGLDGMDVRGTPIPARKPKVRQLKLGSGVRRSEGSRYIVAARTGRPVVKEAFVDVIPTYDVPGDVNVATGHIDFAGDVTVRRNVEESLRVRAGGSVVIGGMVLRKARVEAGGSVRVKSVVGGSISAGGNSAVYAPIVDALKRLVPQLEQATENLRRLVVASEASGNRMQLGIYFKALLERHYRDTQKLAQEVGGILAKHKDVIEPELFARIAKAAQVLIGRGPLLVKSFVEIEQVLDELRTIPVELESRMAEADVTVEYLQNAEVACGGKVRLVGKACYNSKVIARTGFEAPVATIRGGSVTVTHGGIVAREIGSPSAVVTELSVAADASIKAEIVHPSVRCIVGHRQYRFEMTRRHVVLHLDKETGELRF